MTPFNSLIKPLFWLSSLTLAIASLAPVAMLPPQTFDVWDKAQHALGFAWLSLIGLLAYSHHRVRVAACLLLYGGAIELAQAATGWRHGEWADLAADGVGIALGTLLWLGLRGLVPALDLKAARRRAQ